VDDRQNPDSRCRLFIEDDVRAMFVTANARRDRLCLTAHARLVRQKPKDMVEFG
jgi:hypothetical protein